MVVHSIKEINRLKKEINRLLSKEMPNIFLINTIEKNCPDLNYDFLSLESSFLGLFLGSSNSRRYH